MKFCTHTRTRAHVCIVCSARRTQPIIVLIKVTIPVYPDTCSWQVNSWCRRRTKQTGRSLSEHRMNSLANVQLGKLCGSIACRYVYATSGSGNPFGCSSRPRTTAPFQRAAQHEQSCLALLWTHGHIRDQLKTAGLLFLFFHFFFFSVLRRSWTWEHSAHPFPAGFVCKSFAQGTASLCNVRGSAESTKGNRGFPCGRTGADFI